MIVCSTFKLSSQGKWKYLIHFYNVDTIICVKRSIQLILPPNLINNDTEISWLSLNPNRISSNHPQCCISPKIDLIMWLFDRHEGKEDFPSHFKKWNVIFFLLYNWGIYLIWVWYVIKRSISQGHLDNIDNYYHLSGKWGTNNI